MIARVMRNVHRRFPHVPMLAVAKEISLEDVRLGLEKLPDRFFEHPATVFVVTNLNYADAPNLMLRDLQRAAALNWQEVRLTGSAAHRVCRTDGDSVRRSFMDGRLGRVPRPGQSHLRAAYRAGDLPGRP